MKKYERKLTGGRGFTLVEILLVVVIVGIMLAVIMPRAWRASIDSKYGLVRQAGTELASFGLQWAEEQLQNQTPDSAGMLNWYLASLCGWTSGTYDSKQWIPSSSANWTRPNVRVRGRNTPLWSSTSNANFPSVGVQEIVPPEKVPRNPFNGASYFLPANNPAVQNNVVAGAMASAVLVEGSGGSQWTRFNYYALVFQGTDSTSYSLTGAATFHSGQGSGMEGLRNGIFLARTR